MDEQVKEVAREIVPQLKEVMGQLLTWAQSAGEFASDQAPLLAEEIIRYGVVYNGTWLGLTIAMWFGWWLILALLIFSNRDSSAESALIGVTMTSGIFTVLWTMVVSTFHVGAFAKAYLAPRLYLIEYLSELVR